ncbi:MAG: hypothetical protein R2939_17865 [Kofleriaceae bacterium]
MATASALPEEEPVVDPADVDGADAPADLPPATATARSPRPRPRALGVDRDQRRAAAAPAALGFLRIQGAFVQDDPGVEFVGRADGFELQHARRRGGRRRRSRHRTALRRRRPRRAPAHQRAQRRAAGRPARRLRRCTSGREQPRRPRRPVRAAVDPEEVGPTTQRWFVDNALDSRGVRATEGFQTPGLSPGRSIGVALRRVPASPAAGAAFGFELAATNGAGELASSNDNDWVAVSAAALVVLPEDGWIMAAGRINPRSVGELPLRQDETDLQAAIGGELPLGPARLGAGAILSRTLYRSTDGAGENAWGTHAQARFDVRRHGALRAAAAYRFAIYDPSDLVVSDRLMEHTLGAILAWPASHLRLQLNLTHAVEQAGRSLRNDRAEAALEIAL